MKHYRNRSILTVILLWCLIFFDALAIATHSRSPEVSGARKAAERMYANYLAHSPLVSHWDISKSAWQSTPCLRFFNAGELGICYNGGLFQEVFNFPRTSWDGSPLPIGSAIGLQMTRLTMMANGQRVNPPYTHMQFIYSKQGGGMFGPLTPIDDAYWVYLTDALNAQAGGLPTIPPTPAPIASSQSFTPSPDAFASRDFVKWSTAPISLPAQASVKAPKRPRDVPKNAFYMGLNVSGDSEHWAWTDAKGVNHLKAVQVK